MDAVATAARDPKRTPNIGPTNVRCREKIILRCGRWYASAANQSGTAQTHFVGNSAYTTYSPPVVSNVFKPGEDAYIRVLNVPAGQPPPPGAISAAEIVQFVGPVRCIRRSNDRKVSSSIFERGLGSLQHQIVLHPRRAGVAIAASHIPKGVCGHLLSKHAAAESHLLIGSGATRDFPATLAPSRLVCKADHSSRPAHLSVASMGGLLA